jgi:hypothetical protein
LWCFRPVFALVLFNLFRFYLCFDLFGGGFVLFFWWSPRHRFLASVFEYASIRSLFRWCGFFTATGGVGVSTSMMVLVFLGSCVVFCLHTCFSSTRVLFLGFWFPFLFVLESENGSNGKGVWWLADFVMAEGGGLRGGSPAGVCLFSWWCLLLLVEGCVCRICG